MADQNNVHIPYVMLTHQCMVFTGGEGIHARPIYEGDIPNWVMVNEYPIYGNHLIYEIHQSANIMNTE